MAFSIRGPRGGHIMNKINLFFFSALVLFGLTWLAVERSKAQEVPDQSINSGQQNISIGGALVFLPITIGGTGSPVTPTSTPQVAATNTPFATATSTPVPSATITIKQTMTMSSYNHLHHKVLHNILLYDLSAGDIRYK